MARYAPDRAGIAEMLQSADMLAEMVRRAELVAARAEAISPFDPHSTDGTHYKESFHVEGVVEPTGFGRDGHVPRAIGRVVNDDPAAMYVEFTNGDRTLGRALDAARG